MVALLFDPNYVVLREDLSNKLFNIFLIASQICGAMAILLVAIWMGSYDEGFAWSEDPDREFHYHPTLMIMGMVFLYGEALIVYRVFRHERKKFSKTLHVAIHSMVIVFMLVALKAVWDSHDLHKNDQGQLDPLPNLMSLHSWIGLSVVCAYLLQYAVGFITYFAPGLSIPMREMIMPFHQFFGLVIFICVSVAVALGISERAAWKHTCWTKGHELCGQQAVSNFLGLFTFGFIFCVTVLVGNPRWKRRPLPEEESLHHLTND